MSEQSTQEKPMKMSLLVLAIEAILFSSHAVAVEPLPLRPGMYEISISAIVGNNAIGGAPRSRCILADDLADPEWVFTQENVRAIPKNYQLSELKIEGEKISYTMTRDGRDFVTSGTVAAEEFSVIRRPSTKPGEVSPTKMIEGKRTGACKK